MDPFQAYLIYSSLALALVVAIFAGYRYRMRRMRSLADRLKSLSLKIDGTRGNFEDLKIRFGTLQGQADLQARIDASPKNADFMELRRFADTEEAGRQEKLRAADATVKAAAASQQAWKAPSASRHRFLSASRTSTPPSCTECHWHSVA